MKKKVVVFIHTLQHYRVPIFNFLGEKCELTIVCENADKFSTKELNFSLVQCELKELGPFLIHYQSVRKLAKSSDVTIGLFNLRCLDLLMMAMNPFRRYKFIFWGIGVSASYTKSFDQGGLSAKLRLFISKFADALIFYSSYPLDIYQKIRDRESLFIANNTIANPYYTQTLEKRNRLLFIGTLYREKGVDMLLSEYRKAYNILGDELYSIDIIGDGEERDSLENSVKKMGLSHKVFFHGAIYDQATIASFYRNTIACISPHQAGLSVLTSMSNAVPFITFKSAITGGEIFSIEDKATGVILETDESLSSVLIDINRNPKKYVNMGLKAREFYESKRLPEMMADGIFQAVKYVSIE